MLWMWLAFAMGCAPKVNLEVLEPAAKTLPEHIKVVATVDRGTAKGRVHKDAAVEAEEAIVRALGRSPRFDVRPLTREESSNFDALESPLGWKVVDAITTEVGAQAIVALESIASRSGISEDSVQDNYTDEKGKKHITLTWTATRTTEVETTWKIYDAQSHTVVDQATLSAATSWNSEGSTAQEARNGLPDEDTDIGDLAYETGEDYGRRIAPAWIAVSRVYFPSGNDRMTRAKTAILAGDLTNAAELWEKIAAGADPRLAAKANFNLGVAWEGRGNLRQAIDHVALADAVLNNGRTSKYLALLKQRKLEKKELKKQMSPVRPGRQNGPDKRAPADRP